jgi:translin
VSLNDVAERVRRDFERRNEARDATLQRTRELIRICSTAIRASHRNEWEDAQRLLKEADEAARALSASLQPYPDLFFAGYTQDALKELAEANATLAMAQGRSIPSPEDMAVPFPAYLNGLCEAASEMRRRCLDEIRRDNLAAAERLLQAMDEVYDVLGSFDFPDAITGGLRRRVDQLRGVLERTRGDLTNSLRQEKMLAALRTFERRLNGEDA